MGPLENIFIYTDNKFQKNKHDLVTVDFAKGTKYRDGDNIIYNFSNVNLRSTLNYKKLSFICILKCID